MTAVIEKEDVQVRFSQVLAARKSSRELIALMDRLMDSKKFTAAEKPVCFGLLVDEAARRSSGADALALLAAVRRNDAIAQVRVGYDRDAADRIAAVLVKRVMTGVPQERVSLTQAIDALIRSKVAVDKGQVFGFASLSGIPHETLDAMCDLTW